MPAEWTEIGDEEEAKYARQRWSGIQRKRVEPRLEEEPCGKGHHAYMTWKRGEVKGRRTLA